MQVALLLIDFINDFEFEGAERAFPAALAAARVTAALKKRATAAGVPVVYCNDHFGKWRSDFRALLDRCLHGGVRGEPIARLLRPEEDDYFVLKPKHSGFHSSPLDVLLRELGARTLVLTGVAGNFCVMFTAHDAYMRDYRLVVPRDCVASDSEEANDFALRHLGSVCRAATPPAADVDFYALGGT